VTLNHALQVAQAGGKERRLSRQNQQRAVAERVGAGIEGHGDQLLRLEPVQRLLAGLVEGLAEALLVGGLIGRQRVADDHRVRIAPAHGRIGEVDGQAIARLGHYRLRDAHPGRRLKDRLILPVVVAVAQLPVGFSRGPSQRPIHKLLASIRRLHQRRRAEHLARMSRQLKLGPGGLKIDKRAIDCFSSHDVLAFRGGESMHMNPPQGDELRTSFYLICPYTWQ